MDIKHVSAARLERSRERSDEMETKIRVVLADGQAVLREAVRAVLQTQPNIEIVGEAEDGRQALQLVDELLPDVIVMDINLPNLNGVDATRQIKRLHPDVQVLVLTLHEDVTYVRQLVKAGATGYVVKRSAAKELIGAIQAAARGDVYFPPAIARLLLEDYREYLDYSDTQPGDTLTHREHDVLQMVAEGRTNVDISHHLLLSMWAVQTHRMQLMCKMDVQDRAS
jgi:two-component system response regulator NreC